MDYIIETINEFGQGMGLKKLDLDENGLLCLSFEKSGTLYLEYLRDQETILVYIARHVPLYDTQIIARSLGLCRHRQELPFSVHAGFKGEDELVFMVRIPARDFTFSSLSQAIDLLKRRHEKAVE